MSWTRILWILGDVLGIYMCFLSQGVVQESIYHTEDQRSGRRFKYPFFLVALTCTFSALIGLAFVVSSGKRRSPVLDGLSRRRDKKHAGLIFEGFTISISYVGAMIATNYALTTVNYPTQVLVKSAKAVPVILGGSLIFGRKYPLSDYITVAMVTGSLIMFQLANLKSGGKTSLSGFLALCLSLTLDGITGPRQDQLMSRHKLSTGDLMLLLNLTAAPLAWIPSFMFEGIGAFQQIGGRMSFFLPRIIAFVLCGVAGQAFIVSVLKELGSLHLTLITTTRKFFAILISVIWFGHQLTVTQWAAIATLFSSGLVKYQMSKYQAKPKRFKFI